MEFINLLFVIASIMFMSLVYVKIYNFENKITKESSSARGTFRDAEGSIRGDISKLSLQMSEMEKNLTTEIACLATKNNEDIKRSKEGFLVGDVIEYAGEETLVLDRETVTLNIGEELTDYIIWNVSKGIQHETASYLEHNAKFLRRASLKK